MKCEFLRLRAVDEHDKALRRQAILEAAERLLVSGGGQLPSVMAIAREAGLAKGTVYLYFTTKEEIFLALLEAEYDQLLQRVAQTVAETPPSVDLVPAVVSVIARFLEERPAFLPLSGMANAVIEQNVSIEHVARFKGMLNQHLSHIGAQINRRLPQLPVTDACRLLLQTHALILGLWQMQNWPERLRPLMTDAPYADLIPDLKRDLESAVTCLWLGALNGRPTRHT